MGEPGRGQQQSQVCMTGACEEVAATIRARLAEIEEEAARLREAHAILSKPHPLRAPARPRARRRAPRRARRPSHPAPEPPPVTAARLAQLDEPRETYRTGSLDSSRRREPVRQVARCHKCGEERDGVTRFESMAHSHYPAGRAIHFCDECANAIVERPLEEVLFDLIGDGPLEQTAGLRR